MTRDDNGLEPIQVLLLWKLMFTGEEPQKSKLNPKLSTAKRDQLQGLNLIEFEKRETVSKSGRKTSAQYVVLTDEAWRWAAENLDAPFSINSTNGGRALAGLLPRLKTYMQKSGVSLADLIAHAESKPPPSSADLRARIREAYSAIAQGRWGVRVRLADLRTKLSDVTRAELDQALLAMQADRELLLYTNDDPLSMDAADHEAALDILGAKRHIVYMER